MEVKKQPEAQLLVRSVHMQQLYKGSREGVGSPAEGVLTRPHADLQAPVHADGTPIQLLSLAPLGLRQLHGLHHTLLAGMSCQDTRAIACLAC